MLLEEFLIMRRMDEIRLEKGQQATMNADHTVTTTAGALNEGPSIPKQAASLNHHHGNQISPSTAADQPADTQKNKYGTFFKWK